MDIFEELTAGVNRLQELAAQREIPAPQGPDVTHCQHDWLLLKTTNKGVRFSLVGGPDAWCQLCGTLNLGNHLNFVNPNAERIYGAP